MKPPFPKPERRSAEHAHLSALGGWVAVIGLVASSCTHDFSEFDVSGVSSDTGGAGQGDGGDGGGSNDGSVGSGGTAGSGGSSAGGGTTPSGGAGGSAGTGGSSGSGGTGTGGSSGSGGRATGGSPGSGGATGGAGGGATGGATGGAGGGATGGAGGGATGGAAGSVACDAAFGTVPGYVFCSETATTCRFAYVTTPARSMCQTHCTAQGATCQSAENGDPGLCTVVGAATCTSQFTDAICICSKP